MKKAQEEMNLKYEVCYECTHHGPSLDVPTMFVELGSSPRQWKDSEAAEAVARGAMAAASTENSYPTVLGIGGPHYNMKFTRKARGGQGGRRDAQPMCRQNRGTREERCSGLERHKRSTQS